MSYIGAQPTTAAFVTDTFSANGSGTVFTLSVAPANTNSILVAVSGVLQDPTTYSVSGTTLTFSAAPPAGTGNISVRFLGIPASGVTTTAYRTVTEFTATAGQTTFTPPSYTAGYINVYRNGALLGTADYTATNGTTVVLASAASSGDLVVVESFYVSSVLNAIPAQNNAVIDSYILSMAGSKLTGSQSIPKSALPTGSVLQVVNADYTTSNSTTSTSYVIGVTGSITTVAASSKIQIIATFGWNTANANSFIKYERTIGGSTTALYTSSSWVLRNNNASLIDMVVPVSYLDSPSQSAGTAITYTISVNRGSGGGTIITNEGYTARIQFLEIAA